MCLSPNTRAPRHTHSCGMPSSAAKETLVLTHDVPTARAGSTVETREWPESVHVQHFRLHPQEYRATLQAFAEGCCDICGPSEGDDSEAAAAPGDRPTPGEAGR